MVKHGVQDDIIRTLSLGPSWRVKKYNQYFINGFHFHTYKYGEHKTTMNYGVTVKGVEGKDYYGVLQEVIELEYVGQQENIKQSYLNVIGSTQIKAQEFIRNIT